MWLHRHFASFLFVYVIVAYGDETISSSRLREIIILKLKTAARLRENLAKVLSYLPIKNYEMYHSIKLIRKYLRDGESLLKSLEVLPSIAYLPIGEQMNEILQSMENYLPRYALPAIEVIRAAINGRRRALDVEGIFRPNYGPLKADLLYKIHAIDLPIVAEKISYQQKLNNDEEETELIEEALTLVTAGKIKLSGALIAQILDNIKINNENPEVRESLKHMVRVLNNVEFDNFTIVDDPYELIRNAVRLIGEQEKYNSIWESAQTLLPYLKNPDDYCTSEIEWPHFFFGDFFNYSVLLSQESSLRNFESGKTLLEILEQEKINVTQAFTGFHPQEHLNAIDLLVASISHLRHYQISQNASSEALERLYADSMKKYRPDDWRKDSLRNAGRMKTFLRGIIRDDTTSRMRRLVDDIMAKIDTVTPRAWREARAFISSPECYGRACKVMQTLRALNDSGGIEDHLLRACVTELLTVGHEETIHEVKTCVDSLENEFPSLEATSNNLEVLESPLNVTINATDLLQAIQGLKSGSSNYNLLQQFLEDQKLLQKILDEPIDLQNHPTRGRLLVWLLPKISVSENVDEKLRKLAADLVDHVSQEGYGAAGLEESVHRGLNQFQALTWQTA